MPRFIITYHEPRTKRARIVGERNGDRAAEALADWMAEEGFSPWYVYDDHDPEISAGEASIYASAVPCTENGTYTAVQA